MPINELLTSLHQIKSSVQEHSLVQGLQQRINDISSKFAAITGHENITAFNFFELRKTVAKQLQKQKRKYRLALETLGWGTLADLLEAALCGKELNITI
jgi:hypothetical protein